MHLMCQSDKSWEFCLWKHTNQENQVVRDCHMEWKRAKVIMNTLDSLQIKHFPAKYMEVVYKLTNFHTFLRFSFLS